MVRKQKIKSQYDFEREKYMDSLSREDAIKVAGKNNNGTLILLGIYFVVAVVVIVVLALTLTSEVEKNEDRVSIDFAVALSQRVCEDNLLGEHIRSKKVGGFMMVHCLEGDVRFKILGGD